MKWIVAAASLSLCITLSADSALAQDEPTSFLFGEYYGCDQNRETFSDLLVEHSFGPIYDKYVESGDLTNWGWMSHGAGGSWRRLQFYSSDSLDKLLETRQKMIADFQANADQNREFISICPDHDDLIWAQEAGSPPGGGQGPAQVTYSTYYICDVSKQERADEIVRELFAPAINKLVESGDIAGWTWYSHVIGGRYRRLMTHSGASHAGLIAAVNNYNQAAAAANEGMANEFSEICNGHVDYLWNRVLPKPEGAD